MHTIKKIETIMDDIRDVRDDQPCPDDDCLCSKFDHAIDKMEIVLAEVIKEELKYIEQVQLPELEDADDKHERDGAITNMLQLESRLAQITPKTSMKEFESDHSECE
tara:strand:- start:845 stop:1165 length:321 start_codon:yes stop_codon:yes gene_type:complete